MSNMTRKEISDLQEAVQARIKKHHGGEPALLVGVERVARELKKGDGVPTLQLRNFGRLLKHYCDPIRESLEQVVQFNTALELVADRGVDVQQAIKKARNATRSDLAA